MPCWLSSHTCKSCRLTGAFSFTIGRIEHAFHVRPDLVATDNNTNPRKYLARVDEFGQTIPARFYVDSLVHDSDTLKCFSNYSAHNASRSDRITHSHWAKRSRANLSNRSRNYWRKIKRSCFLEPPANSLASDFDLRIFVAKSATSHAGSPISHETPV